MTSTDPAFHEQMLRDVLHMTAAMDLADSPPVVGQNIHRRLRELTGLADPYAGVKERFNRMALDMLPAMRSKIAAAADPFTMALRLAIAGNVIDFGGSQSRRPLMPRSTGIPAISAKRSRRRTEFCTWRTTRVKSYSTASSWSACPPAA
jgi:hypothetical protein